MELLQPSTAVAGAALFALLYSALARLWSARRSPLRNIMDRHPLPHEQEAQLQVGTQCEKAPLWMFLQLLQDVLAHASWLWCCGASASCARASVRRPVPCI